MNELQQAIHPLLELAIAEDIASGDITSNAIFDSKDVTIAVLTAKESGVFCGSIVLTEVYSKFSKDITVKMHVQDGDSIQNGQKIAEISGPTIAVLCGERILLNFIQRLSGIATKTNSFVQVLQGTTIKILDTRKTLPGYRILDKYAVKTGGGTNHRMGLFDMVMIKDNHIKAAGSITNAVAKCRKQYANTFKIEVETTTLEEVQEATAAKADIIMLDNMNKQLMSDAIQIINNKAQVEISGNIDYNKLSLVKDLHIDFISIGALTHSVAAFDISMKFQ